MKQAVILAGGRGTRLRDRLGGRPKPLVDLCGVPLLERQVWLLKRYGFTQILVLVNHAAEQIVEFCAARDNWGLDVICIDDGEPRGTAGATLAIFDQLADEFLVMYGDTMLEVDLERFRAFHQRTSEVAATLFLHPNDHPKDSDLVEVDDTDRVLAFHPYPHPQGHDLPNLVNAALYWVHREALAPWRATPGLLDFGKDLFPAMLERGLVLQGYNSPEYIKDIGTPERLDRVAADFESGKISRASLAHPQPVVFVDRDGTLNREVDHLADPEQLELLPGVPAAVRRLNRSGYRCCVVTNQPVVARGECSFEGLRAIHNRLETQLGEGGAYLDRIYVCPHHPHRGFPGERPELKIDCDCRKPKTGLIDRAAAEFNVDRSRSWFVGDTTVDVETARRAGLKPVLLETGYAGLDGRHWVEPDHVAPDLPAAVEFILDGYPKLLAWCATLAERINPGELVLIGGQSRSGKSTLATTLRDALAARGQRALVLRIDRWLRDGDNRGAGVLGRYDLPAVEAVVRGLAVPAGRTGALALPGYDRRSRSSHAAVDVVQPTPDDIIVIEGTVALALDPAEWTKVHRIFVQIDENERARRVRREYRLRGLDDASIDALYRERLHDEVPVIDAMAGDALRVSPELLMQ
ncbi:MAG: HAD-IIIA family hydrolase [Gammaproteobacteria bacterium]|nr:MAG: HAD-IIIA family hydrolase [Gammaproteobacteria bacterium]